MADNTEPLAITDPQEGDTVRTSKGCRTVMRRRGYEVTYVTNTGRERVCWITTWQAWCRKETKSAVTVQRRTRSTLTPSKGATDGQTETMPAVWPRVE